MIVRVITDMNKWIAEFELEDGDTMPEHMDLEYKGVKLDFHCRPLIHPKNDLGVDCIDKAELLKAMDTWDKFGYTARYGLERLDKDDKGFVAYVKYEDMVNCVKNMPSTTPQEPRWISVSERLPKPDEYVGNVAKYYLVQNEYGDMLVARYTHSEYWEQIYQLKPVADEIVAWMPLPKTFEPQESESEI